MNKFEEMMGKLNSFEEPDGIAAFLMEAGVQGDMQDAESCVITNWFLMNTNAVECTTTEEKITVGDELYHTWEFVPNDIVTRFIKQFDDYEYPELVAKYDDYYDECNCPGCSY